MSESLAQQLYEALGDSVGWRDHQGYHMPPWESLPLEIQNGWGEVGRKAAEMLL